MRRIAIIDMGTNTFHLLIADVGRDGYTVVARDHEAVKIGLAGINQGIISEAACGRTMQAMRRFREQADQHSVSGIFAFGTSAFRHARNAPALIGKIMAATGIAVETISGDMEADLIVAGVREGLDLGEQPTLIIDIGAGSVECIIASRKDIFWKESFEIGGQRLLEKFQHHDPIYPQEIAALDRYFADMLPTLLRALAQFKPEVLVGSSGSFDTLSDIHCLRRGIARAPHQPETPLTLQSFYELYDEFVQKDRKARLAIPGMIEMRVDMIVVACCLIRFILGKHPFAAIRVSSYSLKEGALAMFARREDDSRERGKSANG